MPGPPWPLRMVMRRCWTDVTTTAQWSDVTDSRASFRPKGRGPSKDAVRHQTLSRFVPKASQDYPYVGFAFLDPAIAHGFPVVGFLSSWHQNQLQRDAVRLFEYCMTTDLDGGSSIDARVVRRQARVQEAWARHAVRDMGLA